MIFSQPKEFIWDKGNTDKNYKKHNVSNAEAEQVFDDENKVIFKDTLHSGYESRFILLGKSNTGRLLFIVFTIRSKNKIRVISARDINKKEIHLYTHKGISHSKL